MNQVVILGAGYAGLMTALKFEEKIKNREDVKIILVDKNDFHQYIHLSYEMVTGVKKMSDVTIPLSELLNNRKIKLIQATVEKINLNERTVITSNGPLQYSELVIALGSEPNFFNIKGPENAYCVCSVDAVERIKERLKIILNHDKNVRIVVGGGGFTGVELAGEIADELRCCVTVIEGSNMLLPTWEIPEFSGKVSSVLSGMGARILLNKFIVEIKPNAVVLNDGSQIDCDLFIWTGGVQGSHIASESGLKTGKSTRVIINEFCEAVGFPEVYVVGDCALVVDPQSGKPLPQCIEIALQQATNVSKNLYADVTGGQRTAYIPKFGGLILAVGERYGIGRIGDVTVEGKLSLMVKKVLHLHYVYEIAGIKEAIEAM